MEESRKFGYRKTREILKSIFTGMKVVDRDGKQVGTVERVHLGSADDTGKGPAEPDRNIETRINPVVDEVTDALFPIDDMPDTIRQRLLMDGFVRVNSAGLFAADRYVLSDQIERVEGDQVYLTSRFDDLVKRD